MANKRIFKKTVKSLGAAICDEFMSGYYNIEGIDRVKTEQAIVIVLQAVDDACCNANKFMGKRHREFADANDYSKAKREFFRNLFNQINEEYSRALDLGVKTYNEAVPAAVKEANKKAVAE